MSDSVKTYRSGPSAALARLAQLDSRRPPGGPLLVAEQGGDLRAALPLDGGAPFADPFRPTAHLIRLLELQAHQLAGSGDQRAGAAAILRPLPVR